MTGTLPTDGSWLDYTDTTLFTITQFAHAEGISRRTVERWLVDACAPFGLGDGAPYLVGEREWRIPRQAVINFHRWARAKAEARRAAVADRVKRREAGSAGLSRRRASANA